MAPLQPGSREDMSYPAVLPGVGVGRWGAREHPALSWALERFRHSMIIHYLRACFSTDPALIEGKSLRSPGRANEDNRKDAPEARGWGAGGDKKGHLAWKR